MLVGGYSLLTNQLFIMSRVLKNPLGSSTPAFSLANAPSQSLRGNITAYTGSVLWQSRTASQGARLTESHKIIQQGESLETEDHALATISFPAAVQISMEANTKIDFIQTLLSQFLVAQHSGSARYDNTGPKGVSIRSLGLLVHLIGGSTVLSVNPDKGHITVTTAASASATAAYNDTDNVSRIVPVPPSSTLLFDNDTRSTRLE